MAVGVVSSCPQVSIMPPSQQEKPHQFEDLVLALKEALGPSSGLDSKDVDVDFLMSIMRIYDAEEEGWVPYAMADPSRGYTRNLVDEGNGKSNLVSTPRTFVPPPSGVEPLLTIGLFPLTTASSRLDSGQRLPNP